MLELPPPIASQWARKHLCVHCGAETAEIRDLSPAEIGVRKLQFLALSFLEVVIMESPEETKAGGGVIKGAAFAKPFGWIQRL